MPAYHGQAQVGQLGGCKHTGARHQLFPFCPPDGVLGRAVLELSCVQRQVCAREQALVLAAQVGGRHRGSLRPGLKTLHLAACSCSSRVAQALSGRLAASATLHHPWLLPRSLEGHGGGHGARQLVRGHDVAEAVVPRHLAHLGWGRHARSLVSAVLKKKVMTRGSSGRSCPADCLLPSCCGRQPAHLAAPRHQHWLVRKLGCQLAEGRMAQHYLHPGPMRRGEGYMRATKQALGRSAAETLICALPSGSTPLYRAGIPVPATARLLFH